MDAAYYRRDARRRHCCIATPPVIHVRGIYAIATRYNESCESQGESDASPGFFNNGNEGVARIFTSLSRPLYSLNRLPPHAYIDGHYKVISRRASYCAIERE